MANNYDIIPAADAQPGDTYKFTPAGGRPPVYALVLDLLPAHNLVQVQGLNPRGPVWTYINPPVGQVAFGRKTTGGF